MERILRSGSDRVLYRADLSTDVPAADGADGPDGPVPEWFDPRHWERRGRVVERFGGRGEALAVDGPFGAAVLKVYRRGGLVRHLVDRRYVWTGIDRARSVREWRVLSNLFETGLPVPEPLAAYVHRSGPFYEAALLTRRIEDARPLNEVAGSFDAQRWAAVDALVDRFAEAGLRHADLNATNLLVTPDGTLWMVDFDRARLRPQPVDPAPMHARLARSLAKLGLCRA